MQQARIVEIEGRVYYRGAEFSPLPTRRNSWDMIQETGEVFWPSHRLLGEVAIASGSKKTVAAAAKASLDRAASFTSGTVQRVGDLGTDIVSKRGAFRDDAHLPLVSADLRTEAAGVAEDPGQSGSALRVPSVISSVTESDADVGRAETPRRDGLQVGDERAGGDQHLIAPMRPRGMAATTPSSTISGNCPRPTWKEPTRSSGPQQAGMLYRP